MKCASETDALVEKDFFSVNDAMANYIEEEKEGRFMPDWLMDASLKMAPRLFKGVFCYFESLSDVIRIPSFHRLILVGPPGTGKTTLAYAAAQKLNCELLYMPAADLIGRYRNETATNIRMFFEEIFLKKNLTIVIIDELHKLFEFHKNECSDDSQSAAAFWLALDTLERINLNVIVIGTANRVHKLPAELKSRFHGKIIRMKAPSKKNKLQAFMNILENDWSVDLDRSIDMKFINQLVRQFDKDFSLRDIQLLVDTAKMFRFAQKGGPDEHFTTRIGRVHFQQAMRQLQGETNSYKKSYMNIIYPIAQKWSLFLGMTLNLVALFNIFTTNITHMPAQIMLETYE